MLVCVLLFPVSGGGAEGRAPRITEHPVSVVVARHEPLTLRCHADGRPPPEVSWTKDGEPLTRGTRRPTPLPGGLFFLDVAQEDTGVYRCVATNAAGQALSKNATVEVAYLKHDFRAVPTPQVVTAGSTVLLQCGPPRGRPEPAVFWRKDGRTLNLDDGRQQRLRLVDGTNLAIRDAKTSDKGAYQCVAQNAHGTRESPPADVDVAVPPRILTRPTDTTALVGSTVVIRCEVTGDPIPDVLWRRASSSMPLARVHVLPDGSLRMTGLRLSDSGEYVCDADNRAGAVSASAHLAVVCEYTPALCWARPHALTKSSRAPVSLFCTAEPTLSPTPPKVLRLEPGSTATVRCGAKGVPQPLVMFSLRGNRTAMLPGQRLGRVAVSSDKATGVAVVSLEV
ncbi:hypothetical protein ONE63_005691 [Megalurothrips usitatus]|uniref:Ig-like domain-containing protein n=1 Tax=Megalurothrips usitatus TaxID=439358 RepID=A0AAV7Y092_9NEOP|nr:hypothetical protein ONE63_005691 [Megalurothrips usitatus]